MLEDQLHCWTRLQQNYKRVKAGQLTTQSDAVHEEQVYGGVVVYERLQIILVRLGLRSYSEVNAMKNP